MTKSTTNAPTPMHKPAGEYTARYLAYCAAHGFASDPEAMLADDEPRWPGGRMTGFILWISSQWRDWAAQRPGGRMPAVLTDDHHAEFDTWIGQPADAFAIRSLPTPEGR